MYILLSCYCSLDFLFKQDKNMVKEGYKYTNEIISRKYGKSGAICLISSNSRRVILHGFFFDTYNSCH